MISLFRFYEVVRIASDNHRYKQINGLSGYISGMAQNDDGNWIYAVFIFETERVWSLAEPDLVSNGTFVKKEDFETEERVNITVNPRTGEGMVKK